LQNLPHSAKYFCPFMDRRSRPRAIIKGSSGGSDRCVHVFARSLRNLTYYFFGGRVDDVDDTRATTYGPLSVYIEFVEIWHPIIITIVRYLVSNG
jgi:hypothetical protein